MVKQACLMISCYTNRPAICQSTGFSVWLSVVCLLAHVPLYLFLSSCRPVFQCFCLGVCPLDWLMHVNRSISVHVWLPVCPSLMASRTGACFKICCCFDALVTSSFRYEGDLLLVSDFLDNEANAILIILSFPGYFSTCCNNYTEISPMPFSGSAVVTGLSLSPREVFDEIILYCFTYIGAVTVEIQTSLVNSWSDKTKEQ